MLITGERTILATTQMSNKETMCFNKFWYHSVSISTVNTAITNANTVIYVLTWKDIHDIVTENNDG